MIDYKAVVDSVLDDLKEMGIPLEYLVEDQKIQIKINKYSWSETTSTVVNNETYRHLLKMMIMDLMSKCSKL